MTGFLSFASIFSSEFGSKTMRLPPRKTTVAGAEWVTTWSPANNGQEAIPATGTMAPFRSKG